jgi:hypothetical protein
MFTASLSEVHRHYTDGSLENPVYTDAEVFFSQGTHITPNMALVFQDVFSRLSGDTTAPLLKRLETGFGGGKTHTLIACMHLAKKGRQIAPVVSGVLKDSLLPEPGEVDVVAVAGEKAPIYVTVGSDVLPFPIWAEIARQVGGKELEEKVGGYLHRLDSPDEEYFRQVFGNRKVLLLIDELAHYAARWSVAHPKARDMLSSFFMSLFDYARQNPRIAVVVTLASSRDAFSAQTAELEKILSDLSGQDIDSERAIAIQEGAVSGLATVLARDETVVVPVQAKDLSSVLGKRLFERIDRQEAERMAEEYRGFYSRNLSLLPLDGRLDDFMKEMAESYPFHPTLVDFLNNKLSTVATFQKTRGVLRILALAVRALWNNGTDVPMIHASDLDFKDTRTVSELIGRTDNADLQPVINADIGTSDSQFLEKGKSNAEKADMENPHPEKIPYHVATWKTVLLHSLAGQSEGLKSHVFGLNEPDALFAVSRPGLSPSQVQEALKSISEKAYYLHFDSDKYYANTTPTINVPLSNIRKSLSEEQLLTEIEAKARKIIKGSSAGFIIKTDVAEPSQIEDMQDRPILGVLSPRVRAVDPAVFITTVRENLPRINQNTVYLLVHEMAEIVAPSEGYMFSPNEERREKIRQEIFDLARIVLAMKRLKDDPQNYGIRIQHLQDQDFEAKLREREKALETRVSQTWRYLVYPADDSKKYRVEDIRTAGGEGGEAVLQQIGIALKKNGKIITADGIHRESLNVLAGLFFENTDYVTVEKILPYFFSRRAWPILEAPGLFRQIVQEGIRLQKWCLAGKINEMTGRPECFYDADNPDIPLDLSFDKGFALVTITGAKRRQWGSAAELKPEEIQGILTEVLKKKPILRVASAGSEVENVRDDVDAASVQEAIAALAAHEKVLVYEGDPDQQNKPEQLLSGHSVLALTLTPEQVVITKGEAARRGWLDTAPSALTLSAREGQDVFFGLLKKLGSLYVRNATSTLKRLDLIEYELPGKGKISVMIEDASPDTMKHLGEVFTLLAEKLIPTGESEIYLTIEDPDPSCLLVQEINEKRKQGR